MILIGFSSLDSPEIVFSFIVMSTMRAMLTKKLTQAEPFEQRANFHKKQRRFAL